MLGASPRDVMLFDLDTPARSNSSSGWSLGTSKQFCHAAVVLVRPPGGANAAKSYAARVVAERGSKALKSGAAQIAAGKSFGTKGAAVRKLDVGTGDEGVIVVAFR